MICRWVLMMGRGASKDGELIMIGRGGSNDG